MEDTKLLLNKLNELDKASSDLERFREQYEALIDPKAREAGETAYIRSLANILAARMEVNAQIKANISQIRKDIEGR